MKNVRLILIILISICCLYSIGFAQEAKYNHPELDWFTIKTEHFQVHYHNGAERTAKTVAKIAEQIYEPITSFYQYDRKNTFHFIIRDHDDYSNGAAYYYDDKIELWATPMDFDLRGTHPWLLNVISHEFAHMISLDKVKKFGRKIPAMYFQYWGYEKETRPDVLRGFPNQIVSFPIAGAAIPPWFAEGTAQFQSPDIAYDFWDTHRDMILRMAVLKDKMLTYDEMSSFGHNSLGNEMVYNAGFAFVNFIAKNYGSPTLERLNSSMQSPFRLSIGSAFQSVLKKSDKKIYNDWKTYLKNTYSEGIREIQNNIVQGKILESEGFGNFYPTWSSTQKHLAYISNKGQDYLGLTSLVLYDLESKKKKTIKSNIQSSIDFSPDGKKLVYAKNKKLNRSGSKYYELFIYDIETKKEKQLTRGGRVRNPAWSNDGKKIVCVVGRDGTDNLAIYSIETKEFEKITKLNNGEQVFHPSFSPDDKSIVFDISNRHGRDISIIDQNGDNFQYLIKEKFDTRTPIFHPEKSIIFYASDQSGIFNIYQYDLKTKISRPLTNVPGGAFMPSFDPERGLVYCLYTEEGYKIAAIEELQDITNNNYLAQPLLLRNQQVTQLTSTNNQQEKNGDNGNNSEENYQPQSYKSVYGSVNLLPRAMIDYGTLKLGTYLYSSEVLEKYSVFGGFAMNRDWDMDIFGIFEYNHFYPTIFLEIYNQIQHASEGIDKFKYNLLETDFGLQSHFLGETNIARAMFVYSRYNGRIETTVQGQQFKFGYTYMLGRSYTFLLRHNSTRPASDMSINPSGGRKIEFRYDWQHNKFIDSFELNSKYGTFVETYIPYNYHQFTTKWDEYFKLPWKHTLSIRLNGGYIDRSIDSFFNFFAGGILGIKGYPYYSIEGRKLLSSTFTYRFKILDDINFRFLPIKFDKLYGAIFFDYGDAWDLGKPNWDQFKKDAGFQLRLDTFAFYNFPTRIFFDAAYGFDDVVNRGQFYGQEWRFYFGLAFDYID